ncbi:hypothetical protein KDX04_33450 [Burkholderia cenocepacia]|uniref:hypothetical protein n=1 Tax=Burkholderia cenocepacia TaxID=95486 RepID=UPI001B96E4A3|nr:hypothetical protein [Burkholderia cenocepacia]MBR7990749.1 hypothetical protein [Burkholderia cenocepacia]
MASFANFICKFGEKKVLLDLAEDVIIPAFTDTTLERIYGGTSYFFLDTKIVPITYEGEQLLAIGGRFVKNTEVSREQIFHESTGLVRDHRTLRSAPSAVFALILNSHKLIYHPEVAGAPSLSEFRTTCASFIKNKHLAYIDELYEKNKGARLQNGKLVTKRYLLTEFPVPSIEIVALPSGASLREFLGKYKKLKKVSIRILDTNHELDFSGFFDDVRETKNILAADRAELTYSASEGIDKGQAAGPLEALTQTGNADVTLVGNDFNGDKLQGNADEFKVTVPVDDMPKEISAATRKLVGVFNRLVAQGVVTVAKIAHADAVAQHVRRLFRKAQDGKF